MSVLHTKILIDEKKCSIIKARRTKEKFMRKRMIVWMFFTVFAGLLPLIFILYVCQITGTTITYNIVCSEIFFFNIIMSADGLKTLYEIKTDRDLKLTLYATTIFILVCVSVFYGTMLLNNYKDNLGLNLEWTYNVSKILTAFCFVSCASIQFLGGAENE